MEVAAGVVAAEQIISTTIEGGVVAGYALSRPTLPLKATLTCIGSTDGPDSPDSLSRAGHTVNVIDGHLYIFGGLVAETVLAGDEMHVIKIADVPGSEYKVIPAIPKDDTGSVPVARAGHSSCIIDGKIVIFGGYTDTGTKEPIQEQGLVWSFDPSTLKWSSSNVLNERFPQCYKHAAVAYGNKMIVHGGYSQNSSDPNTDTWAYDMSSCTWIELSPLPTLLAPSAPPNLAIVENKLYLISVSSDFHSQIHVLDVQPTDSLPAWTTLKFPTNPLTPGPRPRKGAGLLSIDLGMGRRYLILLLGAKDDAGTPKDSHDKASDLRVGKSATDSEAGAVEAFWSGLWVLQLPSSPMTPASAKDAAREKIGAPSYETEWAEIEIVPREEGIGLQGKSHPGPRGYFASAVVQGGKLVLWGGIDPSGDIKGDGWLVDLKI